MVGVAGRSKACGTCYQRHLKCDETKPICRRCQASKRHCTGYKDQTFISFAASETGLQRLEAPRPNRTTTPAPTQATLVSSTLQFPDTYNFAVPVDDLCIAYAKLHLPGAWAEKPQWAADGPFDVHATSSVEDKLVHHALKALAKTLYATRFQQQALLTEGFQLYRQVLLAVNNGLGRVDCLQRLDLLETILILRGFDSFIPNNPGAWIQHSLGVENLLKMRGPEAHCTPPARKLFIAARPLIITACLVTRKPSVLSDEQWKSIPWSTETDCKSMSDRLIDIFADLPSIVCAQPENTMLLGKDLFEPLPKSKDEGVKMIQELQSWRSEWDAKYPLAFSNVKASISTFDIDPLWPTALAFADLEAAKSVITYDAIIIIATTMVFRMEIAGLHHMAGTCCLPNQDLQSLYTNNQDQIVLSKQNLAAGLLKIYHSALFEACRCIPYYFTAGQPTEMLIPLRQIWINTRRYECEMAKWFNDVMVKIIEGKKEGVSLVIR